MNLSDKNCMKRQSFSVLIKALSSFSSRCLVLHWSVIISFTICIYLLWIADQINDPNHLPLLMRPEKESAMTAFLISLFQTLQSFFKHPPASVASVSPCAIIYVKSRPQNKLSLWRENVGECPANSPDKSPPQGARKSNNSEVTAPRGHKRWWELGEHPPLPPPIPEVGGGGGISNDWCISFVSF